MRKGVDFVASKLSKCKTIQSYSPPSQLLVPQLLYSTRVANNVTRRMSFFSTSASNDLENGPLALSGRGPLKVKNSLSKDKVLGMECNYAKSIQEVFKPAKDGEVTWYSWSARIPCNLTSQGR